MDKVSVEILERLCNGDSRARIAREMDIPVEWIQEAVDEYNRQPVQRVIDDRLSGQTLDGMN